MNQSENRVIVAEHTVYRRYLIPKGFDASRLIEEGRVHEMIDDGELVIENKEGDVLSIIAHKESRSQETLRVSNANWGHFTQEGDIKGVDDLVERWSKVEPMERWIDCRYLLPSDQPYFRTDEEIEKGIDVYAEDKKARKVADIKEKIKNHERLIEGFKRILDGFLLTEDLRKLTEDAIERTEKAISEFKKEIE